ncbi:MAG: nicotinate-nucleotide--dimethylbenzimidazole phosphoribosyltransferase [Polyangia bacterium]
MNSLEGTCRRITPVDANIAAQTQCLLDAKTKPRRSLGRLEDLACRVAAVRGLTLPPMPRKVIVVMGADHGVAEEGVSAYPSEVTGQMLLNFARGGAAINVLGRQAGAHVLVVDMGVKEQVGEVAGLVSRRIGAGTRNFTREPAMTRADAVRAIEAGIEIAVSLVREGFDLVGIGDMGIGNTTASSALVAALTGARPEEVTGRGTGIDDETWGRKLSAIRRGLELHMDKASDTIAVLARLGGFEIAGLAGVVLGAAAERVPIVLDGFIAGTAALVAARIAPPATGYMIASHRSVEQGHRVVLEALALEPLLDLRLRLGEGTGAALAMGLIDASLRILHEMATFEAAGVTDAGT